jgi:phage terminase small subunit
MSLNARQARFVEEYLIDLNATAAAKRAGYSAKTAYSQGERLLKHVEVAAAVEEAKATRSRRTEIDQDEVLREIHRLGFSNIADYVEWGPDGVRLKESTDMSDEALRCVLEVSETKTDKGGTVKFKLHDKKGSLELLGRHLGLFKDNLNLGGSVGLRWEDALKELE